MTLRDGLISLNNVMARSLDEIEEHYFNVEGVANLKQVTFSFGGPTHGLWLVGNNDRARVLDLYVEIEISNKWTKIPYQFLEYKQQEIDGALAWVASAVGNTGDRAVAITLILTRDDAGFLRVQSVSHRFVRTEFFESLDDANEY